MSRDQFFDNLFNVAASAEEYGFQKQLSYENRIVRRVFNECGVRPPSWGALVNQCKAETGSPDLSFSWFNHNFPRFPGMLCGKRIGYCGYRRDDAGNKTSLSLYQLSLADIFRDKNNLLVRAISNALRDAQVDTDQPFIFVFPVVRKMYCAHNMDLQHTDKDRPRVQWVFNDDLRVESSITAFQAIGADWYAE